MKTEVYGNKASRYNFINQKLAFLVHKITRSDEEPLEVTNISRNVISSDFYKIATEIL